VLERIGKYEIRLQIGRGAMGVVYEAWDTLIERRVALKTLRTDRIDPSQLPDLLARFRREAQAVGRLSHPHIVTIHDYGDQGGTPFLVMEYIAGHELAHDLARSARFPLEVVVRIMTQMLGALAHAHEHGVVHRDLKPANMFLLDDGSLKVVDFGIARVDDSDFTVLTSDGATLGTPAYMSPEQVNSLPADNRSDLFSAGVILYEMLVGERPFTGESVHTVKQKVRSQEPLRPSEANPTVSPVWDRVISRALAKKPSARYETARQFAEAIKAAHQAERVHGEESRLKAAEANEHALRAAEERSRAAAQRRAEEDLSEADRAAKAEPQTREVVEKRASNEAEFRAHVGAKANASPSRLPAFASAAVVAVLAIGGYLYVRQSTDSELARAEAARLAAETRAREEVEKRTTAEALARGEAGRRSKLDADAASQEIESKRKAALATTAISEEHAKIAAEEKARALTQGKAEIEKKRSEAASAKSAESRRGHVPGTVFQDCPECPRMVVIPAGGFMMGSSPAEAGRRPSEGPHHRVSISRPFAAGVFEVTFDEWEACSLAGGCRAVRDHSGWGRGRQPAKYITWEQAKNFAAWLSQKTGKQYRLLTEAEWEYVARAGTESAYSTGHFVSQSDANYLEPRESMNDKRSLPVGSFKANAFGLYDVHGNVPEWTEDCWNVDYSGAPADGSAWLAGNCAQRVLRGGSYLSDAHGVRSASRYSYMVGLPDQPFGLRVARTLE
jgi:formylglycine-generating enzyme required for sulfatase activity/tRNA A-37 threonylcarbamoyl transferase component Bud32